MHELAHEFTSRKVSPWGGIKFFQQTYERTGLKSFLEHLDLPYPGSNRGYHPIDLIEGFLVSVVLGSTRLEHSGMIRTDEVIQEVFGWEKGMCSASTLSRFFAKFSMERNNSVFPSIMKFWFDQQAIEKMTIDIDSTVITRYGNQELARKGYNPQKRGRNSHHPIMAFCDELKMVINAWMRSGDSHSNTDMIDFTEELLEIIPLDRIGLIRGDSGFYGDKIFKHLETGEDEIPYLIRAKIDPRLMSHILEVKQWYSNDDVKKGTCYSEISYKAETWKRARRFILVRTPESVDSDPQGYLFEQEADRSMYNYKAYVTNTSYSAVEIHRLYNGRGDCENRIKELKYDYGINGFALQSFGAMEAAFRFIMVAYNIMSLFRQKVMVSKKARRLATIKFQCIAIGSYMVKSGRKKKMKLSAEGKRRHFLEHFFANVELLKPPFQISNA